MFLHIQFCIILQTESMEMFLKEPDLQLDRMFGVKNEIA